MKSPGTLLTLCLLLAVAAPVSAQQFGGSLAIGDEDIFVSETRNQVFPGLVYVFRADGDQGTWKEAARLRASEATEDPDRFGQALAAEGGLLLVGATAKKSATGAVYAFQKDASGAWNETASLTAPDGLEGDAFGNAIALHGEVALVAAPGHNDQTGAVYVFHHEGNGVWTHRAKLTGSNTQAKDRFGSALALNEEVALVAAPAQQEGTGAVYVFQRDASGAWNETGMLNADGLSEGSRFGTTLGLRDGLALVGAPRYERRVGAVFVFEQDASSGAWIQQTRLSPFEAQRFSQFGASITFAGDAVWIGTPGANRRQGSLYAFQRDATSGQWVSATRFTGNDLDDRASFGSTAIVRDNLAVVGATGVDFGEGAAIIYEQAADGTWRERNTVINDMKGFASIVGGEVKCSEEKAAGFACSDVDLVSFLSLKDIGGGRGTRANDIWGWTDPQTDREYALVGRSDGTSFIDVTDPYNPVFLGDLPKTAGSRSNVWRDVKVYKDHAFIVADGAGSHGIQIFDLARLRDVENAPVTFEETAHYDGIHSSHNIVINEDTGFAYAVGNSSGGETCGGGLHMINIQEPTNPAFAGCFADPTTGRRKTGYSHDAQCVVYHGPDTEHRGKEICLGANETALSIADVTDKENPAPLAMAAYPKVAYTHQGWLTEDHRYFYMNDEGDEPQGLVDGTRTLIWDVTDLDDPILVKEHIATTTTTDHNLYIRGNLMYQSNYGSGLRILDITNPENPVEVGYFDTMPYEGGGGGSWSNYPYFKSGVIIVTSIGEGLFVLKKKDIDI